MCVCMCVCVCVCIHLCHFMFKCTHHLYGIHRMGCIYGGYAHSSFEHLFSAHSIFEHLFLPIRVSHFRNPFIVKKFFCFKNAMSMYAHCDKQNHVKLFDATRGRQNLLDTMNFWKCQCHGCTLRQKYVKFVKTLVRHNKVILFIFYY
jgi:hypothetical protein